MNKIDKRFISKDFLLDYFPSPDRFHEKFTGKSSLAVSEQRYLTFKENINKQRARSGKSYLSDADLALIINESIGYLQIKNKLKPNQHL